MRRRLRAAVSRQSAIEPDGSHGDKEGYAWIDREWGLPRARIVLTAAELTLSADTREDLAAAAAFVGQVLQGLVRPLAAEPLTAAPAAVRPGGEAAERWGRPFLRRAIAAWPDMVLPVLGDTSPREAALLPALRRSVAGLLGALERDLARQKRLGRAWAEVSGLWESLGVAELAPAQAARTTDRGVLPRQPAGGRTAHGFRSTPGKAGPSSVSRPRAAGRTTDRDTQRV